MKRIREFRSLNHARAALRRERASVLEVPGSDGTRAEIARWSAELQRAVSVGRGWLAPDGKFKVLYEAETPPRRGGRRR